MSRAADHVVAFNQAVTTGDWDTVAARFAENAVMSFVQVPAGPFEGRTAITAAYRKNSPTETMTLLDDGEERGAFALVGRWYRLDGAPVGTGRGRSGTHGELRLKRSNG